MSQAKNDTPQVWLCDLAAATGLLTRVPLRVDPDWAKERGAASAWAYPVVGAGVAALGLLVAVLTQGLGAQISAALALAVTVVVTGALHEDGLSDAADGLWGGWTKERRLEIMKDSRIGAYGVLALVFGMLLRWQALSLVLSGGLGFAWLAAAALGRASMTSLMAWLPNARAGGLSASVGRPGGQTALVAIGIASLIAIVLAPSPFWVLLIAGIAAFACAMIAKAKIGGQTGDILGATGLVTETAVLLLVASHVVT